MTKEELLKLGLTEEQCTGVFALRGSEVANLKQTIATLQAEKATAEAEKQTLATELQTAKTELTTVQATKETLETTVTTLKSDLENTNKAIAQKTIEEQVTTAIATSGAIYPDVIKPLVMTNNLQTDEQGNVTNIEELLNGIRETHPKMFSGTKTPTYEPKTGGTSTSGLSLNEAMAQPGFNMTKYLEEQMKNK